MMMKPGEFVTGSMLDNDTANCVCEWRRSYPLFITTYCQRYPVVGFSGAPGINPAIFSD
jgi:hypothetical protein